MQRRVDHIGDRHVLVSGQALQLIHQIVRKRNALHHPLIITKTCAVVTNLNLDVLTIFDICCDWGWGLGPFYLGRRLRAAWKPAPIAQ